MCQHCGPPTPDTAGTKSTMNSTPRSFNFSNVAKMMFDPEFLGQRAVPCDNVRVIWDALGATFLLCLLLGHASIKYAVVAGGGGTFPQAFHEDVHFVFETFEIGESVDSIGEEMMGKIFRTLEPRAASSEQAA